MLAGQPDFFLELAEHRFLYGFTGLHAALRKLPAPIADSAAQQELAGVVGEYDADVGAEAFGIYLVVAHKKWNGKSRVVGRYCCVNVGRMRCLRSTFLATNVP